MTESKRPHAPLAEIQIASALDALARAKRELKRARETSVESFEERRDQELNALIAGNHVCDWVFPDLSSIVRIQLASRYLGEAQEVGKAGHLAYLLSKKVPSFRLAREVANEVKHRRQKQERPQMIATSSVGNSTMSALGAAAASEVRIKIVDTVNGKRYRADELAAELVAFWEDFFVDPVGAIERAQEKQARESPR